MVPQTYETESNGSNYAKSETSESMPETESSVCSSVSGEPQKRVGSEPKKKLKGVWSGRLLRLSSMRSSSRRPRSSHYDNLSQSSEQPSSNEMLDASPHYMNATSSSHAKESFQASFRIFKFISL